MKRYYQPTEVLTGAGCLDELGRKTRRFGQRALLVCGRSAIRRSGVLDRSLSLLADARVAASVYDGIISEPTLDMVKEGVSLARTRRCQVIIGIGGGSAMDAAKAIAGLLPLPGTVEQYHAGRSLEGPALAFIAVPTTAGTGAEVTKNAVLVDVRNRRKHSIRDDSWMARVALADPSLTVSMPPKITASTGSDALSHAVETFVSTGHTSITDALASEAIRLLARSLLRAYEDGDDLEARSDTLYASLMAGMALASSGLGGVHGMAHPLGSHHHMPHGTVCGLLLPYVMKYNIEAATAKYARIATLMGTDTAGMTEREAANEAVSQIRALLEKLGIPRRLAPLGVSEKEFDLIIEQSLPSGSLKRNPRQLEAEDVRNILYQAL